MRIVAALGGNALAHRGEPISVEVQRRNLAVAAAALAPVLERHQVVLTHGNGPQVGLLLLESEACEAAGAYPLDVIGAESEGMIGYLLEQALKRELPQLELVTLLTQTVVDRDDPAFGEPSKPIGPLYDEQTARRLERERGLAMRPDTGGFRRVVPSPQPRGLLQERAIRTLVRDGVTVIASGGGGVPVVLDGRGRAEGVEGVVDKDLAAVVLAEVVEAGFLLLLTDVEAVYRGFGTPGEEAIADLSAAAARELLASGELGCGSMAPKVEAAVRFAERGGTAVICSLDQAEDAVHGRAGTRIQPVASAPGARAFRPQFTRT